MKTAPLFKLYQRYRNFLSPLLLVLALGTYVDLRPLLNELRDLSVEEKNLAQQLKDKEQALHQTGLLARHWQQASAAKTKKSLMDQMIQLVNLNFCELIELQTELHSSENAAGQMQGAVLFNHRLQVRLRLRGDFFRLHHFLVDLLRQGLPLQLDRVSFKDEGGKIDLLAQFSAFPWVFDSVNRSTLFAGLSCCARNPFEHPQPISGDPFEELTFEELRYVGFLSEAGKTAALILLPDGRSVEVYPNSRLGKRPWRVLSIARADLLLLDEEKNVLRRILRVAA